VSVVISDVTIKYGPAMRFIKPILPILLFCVLALSTPLDAHELRPAVGEISFDNQALKVNIRLNLEAVLADLGPEHDDSNDSPNSAQYDQLRAYEPPLLKQALDEYKNRFEQNINVRTQDGDILKTRITNVSVPEVGDKRIARDSEITLLTELTSGSQSLTWQWDKQYGPLILRMAEPVSDNAFSQYLSAGEQSEHFAKDGVAAGSVMSVIVDYVKLGYLHILPRGLDHILFVIGLFLLSPRWRPILWQVSAFTLAHTITLALGVLGYVSVSPSIVEPLIALSICVICLENLMTSKLHAWRLMIVIGFGLLHGLGFAGVLGDVGLPRETFITALLSFNVGVELGQLSVIVMCFVLIGWLFKDRPQHQRKISVLISSVLAAFGAFLFLDRVWEQVMVVA